MQELLPDRKRVTTRSYLPISPVDIDTGKNFTCVAANLAVPMGKRATVTLNVHRKSKTLSSFSNIYEEREKSQSFTIEEASCANIFILFYIMNNNIAIYLYIYIYIYIYITSCIH